MWNYAVKLTPDEEDGGFVVTFPDVPEAITQGEDKEKALMYAIDALATALSMYISQRRDLPIPKFIDGCETVRPNALECAKLDLYTTMRAQDLKLSRLPHHSVSMLNDKES